MAASSDSPQSRKASSRSGAGSAAGAAKRQSAGAPRAAKKTSSKRAASKPGDGGTSDSPTHSPAVEGDRTREPLRVAHQATLAGPTQPALADPVGAVKGGVGKAAEVARKTGIMRLSGLSGLDADGAPDPVRVDDVALGAAVVAAQAALGATAQAVRLGSRATSRLFHIARGLAPQAAAEFSDARLSALAERGRKAREDGLRNASQVAARGIHIAAEDETVRDATLAVASEMAPALLEVLLPAVIEAVGKDATQQQLDELLGELLVRTLPNALERTLPTVVMRTATAPMLGGLAATAPVLGRVPGFGSRRSES